MTPDICSNALNEGLINLSSVNLLIIDQCQHVVTANSPIQKVILWMIVGTGR